MPVPNPVASPSYVAHFHGLFLPLPASSGTFRLRLTHDHKTGDEIDIELPLTTGVRSRKCAQTLARRVANSLKEPPDAHRTVAFDAGMPRPNRQIFLDRPTAIDVRAIDTGVANLQVGAIGVNKLFRQLMADSSGIPSF